MTALVSVIVPCYNQAEYLGEALTSVLQQSYVNWECIVVDDGSPDNTSTIAGQFAESDRRISCLRKPNGGLSDARNFGVIHSKGKYILPLDGDDRIGPEYLQLAVAALEKNKDLRVAYPGVEYFGMRQGRWHVHYAGYPEMLLTNSIFCSAMYRRSDYDRIGGYDTSFKTGFEDWEFWIRMLENDDPQHSMVYEIPGVHFYYRIKKNSMVLDLVSSKETEARAINHIVVKHIDKYTRYFGGITHFIWEYRRYKCAETKVRSGFISKLLASLARKMADVQ